MDKKEKIEKILRKHGIELQIGGCGCCGSPWVRARYKGKYIVGDSGEYVYNFSINSFVKEGKNHET